MGVIDKLLKIFGVKKESAKVVCVGLDNSGKTTLLNKLKKDKMSLNKNFWVFTGSTVGVVPIKSKGLYIGKIDKLGSVKVIIS